MLFLASDCLLMYIVQGITPLQTSYINKLFTKSIFDFTTLAIFETFTGVYPILQREHLFLKKEL